MGQNQWTKRDQTLSLAGIKYWRGDWADTIHYVAGDGIHSTSNGKAFICILEHNSASANEPGVGADWQTYWNILVDGGNEIEVEQAAHGFTGGEYVKSSGVAGEYDLAQADTLAHAQGIGFVTDVSDVNDFTIVQSGYIKSTTLVPAQAAGTVMYLDPSNAGAMIPTRPTTSGQFIKPVAIIIESAVSMWVLSDVPQTVNDFLSKVNSSDSTAQYLQNKIIPGSGMTISVVDVAGVKHLVLSSSGGGSGGLVFVDSSDTTDGYLDDKIILTGSGISKAIVDLGGGNEQIQYTFAGAGGGSTVTNAFMQVAHGFTADQIIRSSGTDLEFTLSQADTPTNADVVGIVSNIIDADNFEVITEGFYTMGALPGGAVAGDDLFLDDSVAGGLTLTEPTAGTTVSKPLAQVIDASSGLVYFHNYRGQENQTVSVIGGVGSVAVDATLATANGTPVTAFTTVVAANTYAANTALRLKLQWSATGTNGEAGTIDVKLNGVTVFSDSIVFSNNYNAIIEGMLFFKTTTDANRSTVINKVANSVNSTTYGQNFSITGLDTTSAQTLEVVITGTALLTVSYHDVSVEKI